MVWGERVLQVVSEPGPILDRRAFALALLSLPLPSLTTSCATDRSRARAEPPTRLSHIAVWVDDIDATARALESMLGWTRAPFALTTASDSIVGGLDLALVDANGFWIELVQPLGPGPAMDMLKRRGPGSINELIFRPRDFTTFVTGIRNQGIGLLGIDGRPLAGDGTLVLERRDGDRRRPHSVRIAYLTETITRGTTVELYDGGDLSGDPFTRVAPPILRQAPSGQTARVDRLAIMVEDIERSAAFYTDVLGLRRHPTTFTLDGGSNANSGGMKVSFIDAGSAWLALVQPVGDGPLRNYLRKNGDGFIAELIVEVNDLGAYHDAMKRRGVKLVDTRGQPVSEREKAHVLQPFGDRIGYLPASAVGNMTIEISQRGPRTTSLIHRRDALR
jgi:catechol 2,3-dioxygenase-like lactoylglutathione lyase family enzyme